MCWQKEFKRRERRRTGVVRSDRANRCDVLSNLINCKNLARKRSRGFTLIEVTAAAMATMVLGAILTQGLVLIQSDRGSEWRRQVARFEAANVMEQLSVTPWQELTTEPPQPKLSEMARHWLPEGELTSRVEPVTDDEDSRRIVVQIAWIGDSGQTESPVQLAAWVYRQGRSASR